VKFFLALLVLGLFGGLSAKAGVQAEPYFGYWSGTISQESNSDIATKGVFYGAKLGLSNRQLNFGLDYLMGTGAGNQGGSTGAYDLSSYGPYAALESKWFQLYFTYFVSAKAKLQKEKNPYNFGGSGYRIGLGGFGWGGFKRFGINVEYFSRTYSKYNSVKLSKELNEKGIGFSVSIPFSPFGFISSDGDSGSIPGEE
jgi:hypothetical protein